MARKRTRKPNTGPHIYERGGRYYADLRAYEDVGGGREALKLPGASWGTDDPAVAEALFAARLAELQGKRRGQVGIEQRRSTTLAKLVQDHLLAKAKAGQVTVGYMENLESRLREAVKYFGAGRDPRSIEPAHVRAWAEKLAPGRRPQTVRHFLNALSGAYTRAQELLVVEPGYNPVAMLSEKPTGHGRDEARFYEVHEAALMLEAARIVENTPRGNRTTPNLHALVATLLLTGGRWSEVRGLAVEDVSFDRGLIRFRPNAHRRLKTRTSVRDVPLWPQLREILQAHLYGGEQPRTTGLLLPAVGGGMVGDVRKSLDAIGALCGMEAGEVRTKAFRHTYCSTRLQTVERILRPGASPADADAWEYIEVSRDRVAREMGHGGTELVKRIYGHMQRTPHRADVVEYRVAHHREALGDRLRALEVAGRA